MLDLSWGFHIMCNMGHWVQRTQTHLRWNGVKLYHGLVCNARCHWVQYYVLTQSIDITLSCVLACQRTGTDISLFVHVHHLASAACWTVDSTMASSCCATSCRANVSNALSRLACRLALRITTLLHFSLSLFSYICIYKFLYLVVLFWWARSRGHSVQEYLCEVRSLALVSASAV